MQKSRKNHLAEEDETGSSDDEDDDSEASKEIKSELHYNLKKPKCKLFFYQFSWAILICFSYFVFVCKLYTLPLGEAGDLWRLQISKSSLKFF
jgi:hypothetical protein